MKSLIIRITDGVEDAEMLEYDSRSSTETFKAVGIPTLINTLQKFVKDSQPDYKDGLVLVDEDVIAIGKNCIVAKWPQHKEIVTYAGKAYKINFPASIYIICYNGDQIEKIKAYNYEKFEGMDTILYHYAMPNMLGGDRICMGTAPRSIEPAKYKEALQRIIFTRYTHAVPDNIKGFKTTSEYFDYLSEHEPPYDKMIKTGGTLKREFVESYSW